MEKKNTTIEAFEDLAKMSTDLLKQISGNVEKSDLRETDKSLAEMNKSWMRRFINSDEGLEYIFEKTLLSFIGIGEDRVRLSDQTITLFLSTGTMNKYRIHLPGKENHYEVPKVNTFKGALEKIAELAAELGIQIIGVN